MAKIPASTYRLQLHKAYGFREAAAVVGYLERLGVCDLYLSPYLAAEKGSMHGYNLVGHDRLSPELGGDEGFAALCSALTEHKMGHLLDFVPNHMGIATGENAWWNEVLESGPSAMHAEFFDIDWSPPKVGLSDKVLLPVLGDQYGEVLERGELKLEREGGTFRIRYWEKSLPVAPRSLLPVLEAALSRAALPEGDAAADEMRSVLFALGHLPPPTERAPEVKADRAREKEVIKRRLGELLASNEALRAAVDAEVAAVNGKPGDAGSFDRLDALLNEQRYRLASWRVAGEEINYRRFFDVNDLIAIRMEDPRVFEAAHALVLDLVSKGQPTGLRLDHTDGLYDPAGYFAQLQARLAERAPAEGRSRDAKRPFYVVAEKILEADETLPGDWAIHGTTGYDFLAQVNGLWVDPRADLPMTAFYRRFTGDSLTFPEHCYQGKRLVMRSSLAAEINVLARWLERVASASRRFRDFTLGNLRMAIVETVACFPVYRAYVGPDGAVAEGDRKHVEAAIARAMAHAPEVSETVFAFLRDVLLAQVQGASEAERQEHLRFALKFQQVTGPVMAKSAEDTAFYRYLRLTSLNEVGGDPGQFGTSVEVFHRANTERRERFPAAMIATSTHDTKRGEDVRARIAALSEMPGDFRHAVTRWSKIVQARKREVRGGPAPTRRDEYLFYQTLLGAAPFGAQGREDEVREELTPRLVEYMRKAAKEAKLSTSWVRPDSLYEDALEAFVKDMMGDRAFLADALAFASRLDAPGVTNALAQLVLKLASPGVPDTYQGSELWNLSLVDPDNRQPVDYALRERLLGDLERREGEGPKLAAELLERFADGAVKLHVTREGLRFRRRASALFLDGSYEPIDGGEHVVAFARQTREQAAVAVVPRLTVALSGGKFPLGSTWGAQALRLPRPGRYRDLLSRRDHETSADGSLALSALLETLPVALLERAP